MRPGSRTGEVVYDMTKSVPLVRVSWSRMAFSTFGPTASSPASTQQQERTLRKRVGGEFYSSPVWIESRLYCISKYGQIVVLAASKNFEVLARMELDEKAFATPAVANGVMYLRTQTRLYSVGKTQVAGLTDGLMGIVIDSVAGKLTGRSIFNGKKGLIGVIFVLSVFQAPYQKSRTEFYKKCTQNTILYLQ